MADRPKRSRFGGHDYSIGFVPRGSVENGDAWGLTNHDAQAITIEEGLSHSRERSVVVHEVLHQMLASSGLQLPDKVEEGICTFLGDAIVGHMNDNPSLWKYLLKKPSPCPSAQPSSSSPSSPTSQ